MLKKLLLMLMPFLAQASAKAQEKSGEITTVDLKTILFSLPTLCGSLPKVEDTPAPEGAKNLDEDEWRQIEFVAKADETYIKEQLKLLEEVKAENRYQSGFKDLHVRKEQPTLFAFLRLEVGREHTLPT